MFFVEILKAILFGVVEGVTEWLPISSTGHMILLDELIRLDMSADFYETFSVVIQLGAILAVAVGYWHMLSPVGKDKKERNQIYRLWGMILLGVLPSAAVGLLLDDWLDEHLYNPTTVSVMLIVWGVGFIVIELAKKGLQPRLSELSEITPAFAIYTGLFQALALIPGTSRSGATILGAYILGASRTLAAEYSFLLALPTMAGAGLLKTAKFIIHGNIPTARELCLLAVGSATAFLLSLAVIKLLTAFVKKHSFSGFGAYRIILGAVALLYFFARN